MALNMNIQKIYVELLDEGTPTWRPVSAINMHDLIFKIQGEVPEDEKWTFQPGEIVECHSTKLSGGDTNQTYLIAFHSLSPKEIE